MDSEVGYIEVELGKECAPNCAQPEPIDAQTRFPKRQPDHSAYDVPFPARGLLAPATESALPAYRLQIIPTNTLIGRV